MTTDHIHIAGAGPVGSLLTCLLGRAGREVTVWEPRMELPDCSMAIGITPPSLDILDDLGVGDRFRDQGVQIERARVFENGQECGELRFRPSEGAILSLPQSGTLQILRDTLQQYPSVTFRLGEAFPEDLLREDGRVLACDGAKSGIRRRTGIPFHTHAYGVRFVMADFPDAEELGPDARLYFSAQGAIESFPLPGKQRRWITQVTPGSEPGLPYLIERVRKAIGIDLAVRPSSPAWPFDPAWGLAERYHEGNVILCGDAAHQMSPIGGQGMNTGFADALHLARALENPTPAALRTYTRVRQKAFRAAARRAAWGMWLGTRTGPAWSPVRRHLLALALGHRIPHNTLARTFSMRNLPA